MDVVGHDMPLLDRAFLLLRKLSEDRTEVLAQLAEKFLAPKLRDEDDVVLALPFRVTETLVLIHRDSPS